MPQSVAPTRPGVWFRPSSPFELYGLVFCLVCFVLFLQWPVIAGDTDLWMHLDYGRYVFQHRALPRTAFFSFIQPPRELLIPSWGFDTLVYVLHSWFGYYGLIGLRAIAFLAITGLIFRYLFEPESHRCSKGWALFVGVLCCLALLPRCLAVRPHLLTYAFIVAFLFILEYRPRQAVWLPVLAVLWCNFHGINYAVMVGIVVPYVLEQLLWRDPRRPAWWLLPAAFSTLGVLATPHGLTFLEFVGMPSQPLTYEAQVVSEFRPVIFSTLFSFEFSSMGPSYPTAFNLLIIMAVLCTVHSFVERRIRLSHLLLVCLGGALILKVGVRAMHEFVLLALPVLKANPLVIPQTASRSVARTLAVILVAIFVVTPARILYATFYPRSRYPLAAQKLPEGVVAFLKHLDIPGNLLNHPNVGGYLRWELGARHPIFADMENPRPFTSDDLHTSMWMFEDKTLLQTLLARYDPPFVVMPIPLVGIMEAFPDYVLVFVDDVEALFLNRRHHPDLAGRYGLEGVNPRMLLVGESGVVSTDEGEALARYLPHLLSLYPDGARVRRFAAWCAGQEGEYKEMLEHAESIIQTFPESPTGHRLRGDALRALERPGEAVAAYRMALPRTASEARRPLYQGMAFAYAWQGRYRQAYRFFDKSLDAFAPQTSREDLYILGSLARLAGKPRTAYAIFRYLDIFKTAPDETRWAQRLKEEMARIRPAQEEHG